jgi:ERF superfamily
MTHLPETPPLSESMAPRPGAVAAAPPPLAVLSRMRESPDLSRLAPALVRAQAAMENPSRNRSVQVRTQGGAYSFRYATLDRITDMARRVLAENGLCVIQPIVSSERGQPALLTRLLHESGQWMECEIPLPPLGPNPQAFGSVVTYVRRYALSAMLNIAPDEDDDANRAAGHHYTDVAAPSPRRGTTSPPARTEPVDGAASSDGPAEIGEVVGEAVARVLLNRARLAEGVAEGHALLEDWTRRMTVLEQLRGTRAWEALERELGAGLKRSLGTEPASAFVAALRATEPAHIEALQQAWEGRWAETLAAMQQEVPATYALLRRHVAAQIARVRSTGDAPRAASSSGDAPSPRAIEGGRTGAPPSGASNPDSRGDAPPPPPHARATPRSAALRATSAGEKRGETAATPPVAFQATLHDPEGDAISPPITDPVAFARAYAEAWNGTDPNARAQLARRNVKALGQAARHAAARAVLDRLGEGAEAPSEAVGG